MCFIMNFVECKQMPDLQAINSYDLIVLKSVIIVRNSYVCLVSTWQWYHLTGKHRNWYCQTPLQKVRHRSLHQPPLFGRLRIGRPTMSWGTNLKWISSFNRVIVKLHSIRPNSGQQSLTPLYQAVMLGDLTLCQPVRQPNEIGVWPIQNWSKIT